MYRPKAREGFVDLSGQFQVTLSSVALGRARVQTVHGHHFGRISHLCWFMTGGE